MSDRPSNERLLSAGHIWAKTTCFAKVDVSHFRLAKVGVYMQKYTYAHWHTACDGNFTSAQEGDLRHTQPPGCLGGEC